MRCSAATLITKTTSRSAPNITSSNRRSVRVCKVFPRSALIDKAVFGCAFLQRTLKIAFAVSPARVSGQTETRALQIGCDLGCALISIGRSLLHHSIDYLNKFPWRVRAMFLYRRGLGFSYRLDRLKVSVAIE